MVGPGGVVRSVFWCFKGMVCVCMCVCERVCVCVCVTVVLLHVALLVRRHGLLPGQIHTFLSGLFGNGFTHTVGCYSLLQCVCYMLNLFGNGFTREWGAI